MKKKEMAKRILNLENQMQEMEGKRWLELIAIEKMAKKINIDIDELLREKSQLGMNYRCEKVKEEEKDLPHEILKLIFDKYPEGVSVGEVRDFLKEAQRMLDDIQIV